MELDDMIPYLSTKALEIMFDDILTKYRSSTDRKESQNLVGMMNLLKSAAADRGVFL